MGTLRARIHDPWSSRTRRSGWQSSCFRSSEGNVKDPTCEDVFDLICRFIDLSCRHAQQGSIRHLQFSRFDFIFASLENLVLFLSFLFQSAATSHERLEAFMLAGNAESFTCRVIRQADQSIASLAEDA